MEESSCRFVQTFAVATEQRTGKEKHWKRCNWRLTHHPSTINPLVITSNTYTQQVLIRNHNPFRWFRFVFHLARTRRTSPCSAILPSLQKAIFGVIFVLSFPWDVVGRIANGAGDIVVLLPKWKMGFSARDRRCIIGKERARARAEAGGGGQSKIEKGSDGKIGYWVSNVKFSFRQWFYWLLLEFGQSYTNFYFKTGSTKFPFLWWKILFFAFLTCYKTK